MNLAPLNSWAVDDAKQKLLLCCHSSNWADFMASRRPFESKEQLFRVADEIWNSLSEDDWLEAFAAHPRIGGKQTAGSETSKNWSTSEQSGMTDADQALKNEMAELNDAYYEKFGFVFLICATGKSADEMLAQLTSRLSNSRSEEIVNGMKEHSKITKIRLEKLL